MVDEGPGTVDGGSRRRFVSHPAAPVLALTASGVLVLVGTFMPWVGSGSGARSSYELLGVLDRLDVAPDGPVAGLVRWWPLVPLLVTSAVVLCWWGAHRAAATVAPVAAFYAGGVAVAMRRAATETGLTSGAGVPVCAVASGLVVASACWLWIRLATGRDVRAPHAAPPADRS